MRPDDPPAATRALDPDDDLPGSAQTGAERLPGPDEAARVHFVKRLADSLEFRFEGTTAGAAPGSLVAELIGDTAPETEGFRFVAFRCTVTAPPRSFVAETYGTLGKTTGEIMQQGRIVAGWCAGAPVVERGRLVDAESLTFEGDLVILAPLVPRPRTDGV